MTPLKVLLYLTYLSLGSLGQKTNLKSSIYVQQDSGFYPVSVGDSVTLRCFYKGRAVMFYWYKQILGQKPRLMSSFYKRETSGTFHDEFNNNSRFTLEAGNSINHLTISNLRISDSATYYCIGCYAYDFEFNEGATVSVQSSVLNIQALVHQSGSESIQPGDTVTLKCTVHTGSCDGEHSVYWFKDSEESHPGIIYTHGDRNDQCEKKTDTQTNTCIYNLPGNNLTLSHVGMSNCAVASCGHLLFGKKKKLQRGSADGYSLDLVHVLSGALAFTTILAVILAYTAYRVYKRNIAERLQDSQVRASATLTPNAEGYQDSDYLHYAALKKHKINRPKRQRLGTQTECVYSTVRQ
ncbi:uncharacterized protein LOC113157175 [Anabas testudineus]|uniref:Ig-like domain-containing protein n=1 Tax=Anabas testudineus TaxID=64144 RepID=A0A3Q1J727_ANATE|nr:uncharacterized protein LOC113157175 [Anabas testudineus]